MSVDGGIHDLYLIFTGGSDHLFDVDWFRFTAERVTARQTPDYPAVQRFATRVSNGSLQIAPGNGQQPYRVTVYAPDGRLVARKNVAAGGMTILPLGGSGLYLVRITGAGEVIERRVVRY